MHGTGVHFKECSLTSACSHTSPPSTPIRASSLHLTSSHFIAPHPSCLCALCASSSADPSPLASRHTLPLLPTCMYTELCSALPGAVRGTVLCSALLGALLCTMLCTMLCAALHAARQGGGGQNCSHPLSTPPSPVCVCALRGAARCAAGRRRTSCVARWRTASRRTGLRQRWLTSCTTPWCCSPTRCTSRMEHALPGLCHE